MPKQATINREGQITVPREVRCTLRVRTGDKLLFESDGRVVRVQAVRRSEFSKYRGTGNPGDATGRKSIYRCLRGIRGQWPRPSIRRWLAAVTRCSSASFGGPPGTRSEASGLNRPPRSEATPLWSFRLFSLPASLDKKSALGEGPVSCYNVETLLH